jgi:hypothetical protein
MMKNVKQGLTLLACASLAGTTLAQEAPTPGQPTPGQPTLGRTAEITAQTQTSIGVGSPLILRLGQIQVKDNAGQPLGTLEDIVVSQQGCIDMAVLSLGGTRLVPVPWQIVQAEQPSAVAAAVPGMMTVKLEVDRAKLQQAPTIERAQLHTQLTQAAFTQQINNFFGVQAGATAHTGVGTDTNLLGRSTNLFGRTNMFPTGRTNLFGTNQFRTNTFPPGRNLGRPEGVPPGPPPGRPPGTVPPPSTTPPPTTPPGTSPTIPPPRPEGAGTTP